GIPLQVHNMGARYPGFDLRANYRASTQGGLPGVPRAVRGEGRDIAAHLYRIRPHHRALCLGYTGPTWAATLEPVTYAAQKRVSATNIEERTSGHSVFNVSAEIPLRRGLDFGVGIDNLFDREYLDHLGGYNRAVNPDIAMRERLPGLGRSVYGRLI